MGGPRGWLLHRYGTKVIPLRFDLNPYGFVGRYQAANCTKSTPEQVADTIFEVLRKDMKYRINVALVSAFANSPTYKQAVSRSKRLSLIDQWSDPMLDQIEEALDENSQCGGAYYVPERIQELVEEQRPYAAPF